MVKSVTMQVFNLNICPVETLYMITDILSAYFVHFHNYSVHDKFI